MLWKLVDTRRRTQHTMGLSQSLTSTACGNYLRLVPDVSVSWHLISAYDSCLGEVDLEQVVAEASLNFTLLLKPGADVIED